MSLSHHSSPLFGVGVLGGFSPTVTGITVTVAAILDVLMDFVHHLCSYSSTNKVHCVILLVPDDTGVPSSNIVIALVVRLPPIGTQYLRPSYPETAIN